MAAACGTAWLARNAGRSDTQEPGPFMGRIDYRAVAFGALLPDIVDKPIVWFILRESVLGGHHVGHSLLFSLVLLVSGIAVAAKGDNRLLLIAFGAITHITFDSMTHVPWSILYPFVELNVPDTGFFLRATNIAGEVFALTASYIYFKRPKGRKRASLFVREGRIET